MTDRDWIAKAKAFLFAYQDRLASAPMMTPATRQMLSTVTGLLEDTAANRDPESLTLVDRLSTMLDCEMDDDEVVGAVEEQSERLDAIAEALDVPDLPADVDIADVAQTVHERLVALEALADALGLSELQVGLIATSHYPLGAARRELALIPGELK
jgi:hypothetical protein